MQIFEGNEGFCFGKKVESYGINNTVIAAAIPVMLPINLNEVREFNTLTIIKRTLTNCGYPIHSI